MCSWCLSLFVIDAAVGELLCWLAVTSSDAELDPDVHLEMAELHGLVARECRAGGLSILARWFAARSAMHWALGSGDPPPRAVALALAAPRASTPPHAHASAARAASWEPEPQGVT